MPSMTKVSISVSIYLLRPHYVAAVVEKLFSAAMPLGNGLEGFFRSFPAEAKPPNWFRALRDHLPEGSVADIRGQSPAGMLLLPRADKHFAVTFGHAWQYLELVWVEPEFGRRVVLETTPINGIVELHSQQVFAKSHIATERAPRATSLKQFGVEVERDLVGAVEGIPSDNRLGAVARGGTSLRLKIPLATISVVLDFAAKLFDKDSYRRKFPDIDNLVIVRDEILSHALDLQLDADLVSGAAKKRAVLVAPSFKHGEATFASEFAFGRLSGNVARAPYLQYGSWEQHLKKQKAKPSLDLARATRIHMFDAAGDLFETRTVYECIGYETAFQGKSYVLYSGNWYGADLDFTKMIEGALNGILPSPDTLPPWNGVLHEDEYNKSCCKGSGRLLFDKRIVHYGGLQSKFEFCDFMDPKQKILYFAKITGKSSDSSHLVEQVRRTVELLFGSDNGFRRKLKASMAKYYPKVSNTWLDERPRPGEWKLCLVSMGRTKNSLPLFAKCSVARLSKWLDQAGHPVHFAAV